MSNKEGLHPGRLVLAGFDGTRLPRDVAEALGHGRLGGVILFSRNIETPRQTASLVSSVLSSSPSQRPFVSVDQEGGRVMRLPWSGWPKAATMGATGDLDLIREVGRTMGREMAACGFDLDFAPVFDLDTNPENPVIGDRAFGREPDAAAMALAWADGLMETGVSACGKHFPGHGDTLLDSHKDLPRVEHPKERIENVELTPFRMAAASDIPMIMTAHVMYPALDPERPATLSRTILGDILRRRLGFNGLVVSDDLEMAGARAFGEVPELAVQTIVSGADLVLVCIHSDLALQASEALEKEAARSPAFRNLVAASLSRIQTHRSRFPGHLPEPDQADSICGSAANRTLADTVEHITNAQPK